MRFENCCGNKMNISLNLKSIPEKNNTEEEEAEINMYLDILNF